MAMKIYFTLIRSPELEEHYQMVFSVVSKTPLFWYSSRNTIIDTATYRKRRKLKYRKLQWNKKKKEQVSVMSSTNLLPVKWSHIFEYLWCLSFNIIMVWSYANHGAQSGVITSHSTCCGCCVRDYNISFRLFALSNPSVPTLCLKDPRRGVVTIQPDLLLTVR